MFSVCRAGRGKLTGNEAVEEGLAGKVGVVLLEVLLGGGAQLHGNELEAVDCQQGVLSIVRGGVLLLTHAAQSGR